MGLPPSQVRAGGPGKSDPGTFRVLTGRVDESRLTKNMLVVSAVMLVD